MKDQAPYHREADRFEPRLARSVRKAGRTLRNRVNLDRVARAFQTGSEAQVLAALGDVEDAFKPSSKILADAFARGQKLAAQDLAATQEQR